jgi:hypothetical protein
MRTRIVLLAAAVAVLVGLPFNAVADTGYGAPYEQGPSGGDSSNVVQTADPTNGRVTILRASASPGAVSCGGTGGFTYLQVTHTVSSALSSVTVQFTEAAVDGYTFPKVAVRAPNGEYLAPVTTLRGPVVGDGSMTVSLAEDPPALGSTILIQFGLEVASACPPAQSVDGGTLRITSVAVA